VTEEDLHALRRHGFGVAYRMLGSVADAEDAVQEALLRLSRLEEPLDEPAAWMTTVTTRLAIDHLRLARVRRETYVGPWLPDPLVEDAAAHVERADSLSQAFLVVLEHLSPMERAAFLLREVFDYEYPQIAEIVDRSEAYCRQLVVRARRHAEARRPRFDPDPALRADVMERFLAAAVDGDLDALERLLARDAALYSDGGGKAGAFTEALAGAGRIARIMAGATRARLARGFEMELVTVNGQPGRLRRGPDGRVVDVLSIDVVDGRIQTVRFVSNPDKLAHL
jgi:RNA polymerase sigma-70 factor (ECF subfamily)